MPVWLCTLLLTKPKPLCDLIDPRARASTCLKWPASMSGLASENPRHTAGLSGCLRAATSCGLHRPHSGPCLLKCLLSRMKLEDLSRLWSLGLCRPHGCPPKDHHLEGSPGPVSGIAPRGTARGKGGRRGHMRCTSCHVFSISFNELEPELMVDRWT